MPFNPDQISALKAKLDPKHVKERKQADTFLSYVEGWFVIAEANRIFGFDKWTRETVDFRCVHEGTYPKTYFNKTTRKKEISTGPDGKPIMMARCTYVAKVRVTAEGVTREGCGSGHGFAENPGEAHESALKEAETDAMKRALMTFGNPFGLALYDKTRENVGTNEDEEEHGHATNGSKPPPARDTSGDNLNTSVDIQRRLVGRVFAEIPAPDWAPRFWERPSYEGHVPRTHDDKPDWPTYIGNLVGLANGAKIAELVEKLSDDNKERIAALEIDNREAANALRKHLADRIDALLPNQMAAE